MPSKIDSPTGIMVILYTHPTEAAWAELVRARESHPSVPLLAVVNPGSGPGRALEPSYVSGIGSLQAAGVSVIGYVHTSRSSRPLAEVEADVASYLAWYPSLDGIFIDEMQSVDGSEAYYSSLAASIRSAGFRLTVGNPGTDIARSYEGIFTVLVVWEDRAMPTAADLSKHSPKSGFAYIANETRAFPAHLLSEYVQWLYVYDLTTSDYNTLSKWMPQMLQALS